MNRFSYPIFVLLLCMSFGANSNEYNAYSSNTDKMDDDTFAENKLNVLQREVQSLMGRIEILEHTVSTLKSSIDGQKGVSVTVEKPTIMQPLVPPGVSSAPQAAIAPVSELGEKKQY